MKHYRKEIHFHTEKRCEFINITRQAEAALKESGIQNGLCLINSLHITSSIFINDDEKGLHHDLEKWLEKMVPHSPTSQYRHNDTGEQNADSHIKREIIGRSVTIAITDGKFDFGTWEQIFYGEFDGQRKKRILIKLIGD